MCDIDNITIIENETMTFVAKRCRVLANKFAEVQQQLEKIFHQHPTYFQRLKTIIHQMHSDRPSQSGGEETLTGDTGQFVQVCRVLIEGFEVLSEKFNEATQSNKSSNYFKNMPIKQNIDTDKDNMVFKRLVLSLFLPIEDLDSQSCDTKDNPLQPLIKTLSVKQLVVLLNLLVSNVRSAELFFEVVFNPCDTAMAKIAQRNLKSFDNELMSIIPVATQLEDRKIASLLGVILYQSRESLVTLLEHNELALRHGHWPVLSQGNALLNTHWLITEGTVASPFSENFHKQFSVLVNAIGGMDLKPRLDKLILFTTMRSNTYAIENRAHIDVTGTVSPTVQPVRHIHLLFNGDLATIQAILEQCTAYEVYELLDYLHRSKTLALPDYQQFRAALVERCIVLSPALVTQVTTYTTNDIELLRFLYTRYRVGLRQESRDKSVYILLTGNSVPYYSDSAPVHNLALEIQGEYGSYLEDLISLLAGYQQYQFLDSPMRGIESAFFSDTVEQVFKHMQHHRPSGFQVYTTNVEVSQLFIDSLFVIQNYLAHLEIIEQVTLLEKLHHILLAGNFLSYGKSALDITVTIFSSINVANNRHSQWSMLTFWKFIKRQSVNPSTQADLNTFLATCAQQLAFQSPSHMLITPQSYNRLLFYAATKYELELSVYDLKMITWSEATTFRQLFDLCLEQNNYQSAYRVFLLLRLKEIYGQYGEHQSTEYLKELSQRALDTHLSQALTYSQLLLNHDTTQFKRNILAKLANNEFDVKQFVDFIITWPVYILLLESEEKDREFFKANAWLVDNLCFVLACLRRQTMQSSNASAVDDASILSSQQLSLAADANIGDSTCVKNTDASDSLYQRISTMLRQWLSLCASNRLFLGITHDFNQPGRLDEYLAGMYFTCIPKVDGSEYASKPIVLGDYSGSITMAYFVLVHIQTALKDIQGQLIVNTYLSQVGPNITITNYLYQSLELSALFTHISMQRWHIYRYSASLRLRSQHDGNSLPSQQICAYYARLRSAGFSPLLKLGNDAITHLKARCVNTEITLACLVSDCEAGYVDAAERLLDYLANRVLFLPTGHEQQPSSVPNYPVETYAIQQFSKLVNLYRRYIYRALLHVDSDSVVQNKQQFFSRLFNLSLQLSQDNHELSQTYAHWLIQLDISGDLLLAICQNSDADIPLFSLLKSVVFPTDGQTVLPTANVHAYFDNVTSSLPATINGKSIVEYIHSNKVGELFAITDLIVLYFAVPELFNDARQGAIRSKQQVLVPSFRVIDRENDIIDDVLSVSLISYPALATFALSYQGTPALTFAFSSILSVFSTACSKLASATVRNASQQEDESNKSKSNRARYLIELILAQGQDKYSAEQLNDLLLVVLKQLAAVEEAGIDDNRNVLQSLVALGLKLVELGADVNLDLSYKDTSVSAYKSFNKRLLTYAIATAKPDIVRATIAIGSGNNQTRVGYYRPLDYQGPQVYEYAIFPLTKAYEVAQDQWCTVNLDNRTSGYVEISDAVKILTILVRAGALFIKKQDILFPTVGKPLQVLAHGSEPVELQTRKISGIDPAIEKSVDTISEFCYLFMRGEITGHAMYTKLKELANYVGSPEYLSLFSSLVFATITRKNRYLLEYMRAYRQYFVNDPQATNLHESQANLTKQAKAWYHSQFKKFIEVVTGLMTNKQFVYELKLARTHELQFIDPVIYQELGKLYESGSGTSEYPIVKDSKQAMLLYCIGLQHAQRLQNDTDQYASLIAKLTQRINLVVDGLLVALKLRIEQIPVNERGSADSVLNKAHRAVNKPDEYNLSLYQHVLKLVSETSSAHKPQGLGKGSGVQSALSASDIRSMLVIDSEVFQDAVVDGWQTSSTLPSKRTHDKGCSRFVTELQS